MATRKTDAQIDAQASELQALKTRVRQYTAFGDDNHAALDAQCAVLRKRMSMDDVYIEFGDEESPDFTQHTLDAALEAHDWMTGLRAADEGSPSQGWTGPGT